MTDAPRFEEAVESALAAEGDAKAMLERLLLALDDDGADELMLLLKESRGAWALLLGTDGGRALFLGDARSGTVAALAMLGFQVVAGDADPARLRLSAAWNAPVASGRIRHARVARGRLPFRDDTFDLVVCEGSAEAFGEAARVARGERVLVADNRLAYKRSTGRRGRFHKPGPLEWLRHALRPPRGERTLAGYRRLVGGEPRAFAPYPDAREFSHVVALDAPTPRLTVGPKERTNRFKVWAQGLGLFPWLTPSYALLSHAAGRPRLERVLDALAERIGEPRPDAEVLIATRSNTAVVLCGEPDRPGGWVLHVPLSPRKAALLATHARFLRELPERFPDPPVPALLFEGEVEGVRLTAERRLGGLTAPQLTGDVAATRRLFLDVSRQLAGLTLGPARTLDETDVARLLDERLERARALCAVPSTARFVARCHDELREVLVGARVPLAVYHADLRAKHVQATTDGRVLGLLDWGASEDAFLPYVDLLHLVVQQRKQEEEGAPPAGAWRALCDGALAPHEREALEDHAGRLALAPEVRRALERAYPALVAGMTERNWDYSRPRWVHRQYEV